MTRLHLRILNPQTDAKSFSHWFYNRAQIGYGANMAERTRKQKTSNERTETDEIVEAKISTKGEKLKADLDDLLDEIDEVLETNAEDFVKSYVQKGGQ